MSNTTPNGDTAAGLTGAPRFRSAPLGSTIWAWEDLKVIDTAVGARREVVDQATATLERFECHISTLNAGLTSHASHRHAQEEFIILREGLLDVEINGELRRAGPGSLIFFAANDWHHVHNVGREPATYFVFNLFTAATRHAPLEGATKAAGPELLYSGVWDWEKLSPQKTPKGCRREIIDAPTITCTNLEAHITTINPGEAAHAPHRHADEELVIVKNGRLEVTIDGRPREIGPGSVCFITSDDEHGLRNSSDDSATYYIVRFVTAATRAR